MFCREHVHSKPGACFAVGCMMMGLLGMAYFSAPSVSNTASDYQGLHRDESVIVDDDSYFALDPTVEMEWPGTHFRRLQGSPSEDEEDVAAAVVQNKKEDAPTTETSEESDVEQEDGNNISNISNDTSMDPTTVGEIDIIDETSLPPQRRPDEMVVVCGMEWRRRTLGILSAIFSGSYGGSIMVPMKWAPDDAKGLGYLISFAVGATTINILAWIIRYLYLCQKHASPKKAYYALPSFHFRKMWLAGGASGLLWSIGNFFSVLSVEFLGEGVGYSVVQAAMLGTYVGYLYYCINLSLGFRWHSCQPFLLLAHKISIVCFQTVSGLWGIFYFHEIRGAVTIAKWFCSALLTVLGILLLSYEHHEK
jgi:hypothetical protein